MEGLLAERGIQVSDEAIRLWCQRFGPAVAAGLRRRRARAGDCWHLDEVQLKLKGKRHWLWRAVDRDGLVLDLLVQERRNQLAAERFLRRVLEGEGTAPRVSAWTCDLATSRPTRSRTSSGATPGPAPTASAASSVKPPAKTAARRSTARSGAASRA